jgi:DNA-directed RNA polymerase specialized sigma24 family protein
VAQEWRKMSKPKSKVKREPSIDAVFQAFPPLDSPGYVAYITTAATADVPPEALVRAFRQVAPDSAAARATLERLFRKTGKRWDYLGPLVRHVRRRSQNEELGTHEDILQDALRRILETLPTSSGVRAERGWHSFCRWEEGEAWRERYGRRGERIPKEELLAERSDETAEPDDLFAVASEIPPWHSIVEDSQVAQIETIARQVAEEIPDDFLRQLALAAWFNTARPAVSGHKRSPDGTASLASLFKDKSRHQITRALRHLDAQLAAALLAADDVSWTPGVRALLERLKGNRVTLEVQVREQ